MSGRRNNFSRRRSNNASATPARSYQGPIPELKDDIFDIGSVSASTFPKTVKKIESYVQRTCKDSNDIVIAIRTMTRAVLTPPNPPTTPTDPGYQVEYFKWTKKFEAMEKRIHTYSANESTVWAIIIGQCTPGLISMLEGNAIYIQAKVDNNIISLLECIQGYCCGFDTRGDPYMAIAEAFKKVFCFFQDNNVRNDDFHEDFKALIATLENYAGENTLGFLPTMVKMELGTLNNGDKDERNATAAMIKAAKATARNRFLAAVMLLAAHKPRYARLRVELKNSYGQGKLDCYPVSTDDTLEYLNTYTSPDIIQRRQHNNDASPAQSPGMNATPAAADEGVVLAQATTDHPGPQPYHANLTCHDCGKVGHIQRFCPDRTENQPRDPDRDQVHTMVADDANENNNTYDDAYATDDDENIFIQNEAKGVIDRHQLLLDSQSTISQFANGSYLSNIRPASRPVKVHCNSGSTSTDMEGDFSGMPVYYNKNGIANILSLYEVGKLHRVTYDSWDRDGVFQVHTPGGIVEFTPTPKGLHTLNLTDAPNVEHMFVSTVAGNMEGFTRREVAKAHEARRLQAMLGNPSARDYEGMVREKLITNCPVTVTDVKNAQTIFGPDLAGLRGKTVRRRPEHVRTDYVEIPKDFLSAYRNVTLTVDVMFVNGLPFLVTHSRGINLLTIEFAKSRTAANLATLVARVVDIYMAAGFHVQTAMMDMEFEALKPLLPRIVINTTAANEHVGEIERRIRIIKERARGFLATLPFKRLPKRIVIELLHFVTMWLNSFPVSSAGISQKWSPRELLRRQKFDAKLHCQAPFGSYCEVHDEPTPTNSMQRCTSPAICLGPTGNLQGSYKFFCLTTGQKLTRRKFTEIPMPHSIIDTVEKFGDNENRPTGLMFANRHGKEISEYPNDDIDDMITMPPPAAPYPDYPADLPGVMVATPSILTATATLPDIFPEVDAAQALRAAENADITLTPHETTPEDLYFSQPNGEGHDTDSSPSFDITHEYDDTPYEPTLPTNDAPSTAPSPAKIMPTATPVRRSGRQRTTPKFLEENYHLFTTVGEIEDLPESQCLPDTLVTDDTLATVCHYIMLHYADPAKPTKMPTETPTSKPPSSKQPTRKPTTSPATPTKKPTTTLSSTKNTFSLRAGLRKFGQLGEAAVSKELNQFNVLQTFTPLDATKLSPDQRKSALASLMFLTEKRNGTIKARACADGRPQRQHVAKEETASPTVATDSLFACAAINAREGRVVATLDIPGAFLHAENDSFVVMKLVGTLAELMVKTAPSLYRKFVTADASGRPVLYVQLQKALYGMLKSALLFYRKLVSDLTSMGFTMNPYDPCVANKQIKGSQMTICWHVDDLTLSHIDISAINDIISRIKTIYGQNLTEHIGLTHDYLGMHFDYSTPGQVEISMDKYIANVIDSFPEQITGVYATPATDNLFKVRTENVKPLPEPQAVMYHHTVAQLLFASTRVRRDIQTTVAFLTTRVKHPDEDDWGKLKRVLGYLNGTRSLHLTLTVDSLSILKWYVDGSHQIHDDCRGHTGGFFTLGRGAISSSSRKQRINTKSSTETELVAVDDKLGDILWMRYFLESQGYTIDENIIYQDNMSTLSLEKNGRVSGSSRTKHIRAKYFLVNDKYKAKEIDLQYCPTERMWADVLTKPLQGSKFREMRSILMNCPLDYSE